MAVELKIPTLGMDMEEATIVRWLVEEGAEVKKGDPVLEIDTDKTSFEVEAPADGAIRALRGPAPPPWGRKPQKAPRPPKPASPQQKRKPPTRSVGRSPRIGPSPPPRTRRTGGRFARHRRRAGWRRRWAYASRASPGRVRTAGSTSRMSWRWRPRSQPELLPPNPRRSMRRAAS